MEQAAAHLLDFSKPFDTKLLEQFVLIAMDGNHPNREAAHEFLIQLKEHPDMWRRADAIVETSDNLYTKVFGLQLLSNAISSRWKILQQDQQGGIKNYIVVKIMTLAASEDLMRKNKDILSRLNLVLVEILKQEWPVNWPTFISELVEASKQSESLCENNMIILRLLSEEVFDFSGDSMTALKIKTMKESLNDEFANIFKLCEFILENSQKPSLIDCTLQTLQRFLTWIPLGYIFETNLVPNLIQKFFPVVDFRTNTLNCLIEIASLTPNDIPATYWPTMQLLLVRFIENLASIVPRNTDLASAYAGGTEDEQVFIARLALFLSTYMKSYISLFDEADGTITHEPVLKECLFYLIRLSSINDDDGEIFKTCLEFWSYFSKELYTKDSQWKQVGGGVGSNYPLLGGFSPGLGGDPLRQRMRNEIFGDVVHHLRIVMIDHMAKPEEVIVVVEDGEIIREQTKDTEVIAQYKTMRDVIVFLTHLNYDDTETIMLEKLELQVSKGMFSWSGLNTLCWAIGSISGAMSELDEKRFLVLVIRDLLKLCEEQKGKDNKAVVASNIMYIVGQYPRFLRAHWKFLKTVVNKLFEFMHEHHPGVQDMACDTFLKIAQKCKRKFMTPQTEDIQPFILTLIGDLGRHVQDLQPHQVQSFYESVGTMLSDSGPAIRLPREEVIVQLMAMPNTQWRNILTAGSQNVSVLLQQDTIKEIIKILKVNIKVCLSAGSIYVHQLSTIFMDVLQVFRLYSEQITLACAGPQGPLAIRMVPYKTMKSAKSEILELLSTFIESCRLMDRGPYQAVSPFLPSIMTEVLTDYKTAPTPGRDAKVLTLFATAVSVLKENIVSEIPTIMDSIFEPTLEMITQNMSDHPDHRIGFFKFLREANENCFYGLFQMPPEKLKLLIDSIVWAFKHDERNISETGLEVSH